ncbi:uncharacterized protein LOC120342920 isoform X2 [Styela clava]
MAATEEAILPQQDAVTIDHRYRGYVYDLQHPRIPLTGPIGFRADDTKKYPLPNSLIRGNPVLPPTPAKGFFFGSENIRDLSGEERRENKINLRLLDKTSAEIRSKQRAQEEQTEFLRLHREARKREELAKKQEQENDMKQLKTYFPFGKPGYGAPRAEKTGFSKTLQNQNGVGIVVDPYVSQPPKVDWKKTVPIGAPGRPRVRRYEDDQMRRYAVSRETALAYKKELDTLMDIREKNALIIKSIDFEREKDSLHYDPFGKPGAGAPNRDNKGKPATKRSISLSYVNNPIDARHAERVRYKAEEEAKFEDNVGRVQVGRHYKNTSPVPKDDAKLFDPWGKEAPRIDSRGNARRFPRAGDNGIYEFIDPSVPGEVFPRKHIGGGGEPLVGDNGEPLTKRMGNLTTIHGARRSENIPRVATPEKVRQFEGGNSPWGRPGAGAPLTDESGNVVKNTKGRIDKERQNLTQTEASRRVRAKELYRSQLQEGMSLQKTLRDQEKEFLMQPAGDVPSWFSKGKVGRPTRDPETGLIQPQKRVMSDVTAQKLAADRPRDVESYYRELKEQADDRKRMRMKEKERVAQLEAKHFRNFDNFFRKPGHGAPRGDGVNTRRKFSTSAFQAQEQEGTQVLPSRHKTTLQSALYLPYCHDSMSTVLRNNVTIDGVNRPNYDVMRKNDDVSKENGFYVTDVAKLESEIKTCKDQTLCDNCPLKVNKKYSNTSSPVTSSASGISSSASGVSSSRLESSKSCSGSSAKSDYKPFPYRVVAPWAIDG